MLGNIYIIKNHINNKVYVGKTSDSIEHRFREHKSAAYKIDYSTYEYSINTKFYRAIRKYGIDNFYIELLDKVEVDELEQKEIEYIAKYDSYYNGYNSTLGGDGAPKIDLSTDEINAIIDMYIKGVSSKKISDKIGIGQNTVLRILRANNIEMRQPEQFKSKGVVMYNKDFEPLIYFKSKKEIVNWIYNNTNYAANTHSIYGLITRACEKGNIAYGHRWQLLIDLECNGMLFRTKFDKDNYINGGYAYKNKEGLYVVDKSLDAIIHKNRCKDKHCKICKTQIKQGNICDKCKEMHNIDIAANRMYKQITRVRVKERVNKCYVCGKPITEYALKNMCMSCSQVYAKGKIPKPSRDELKTLIDKGMQVKQIANLYDRSSSTVSTWIKNYKI